MSEFFTDTQIIDLTAQIDAQLRELQSAVPSFAVKGAGDKKQSLAKQRQAIQENTGEDPDSFLRRFAANAKKDLCQPGGVLYKQWQEMKDLGSKKMLKTFGGVLAGMGLATTSILPVIVPLCVYVLYIGVETFCEES